MNFKPALLLLVVLISLNVSAQLKMPSFEVALKGGYINIGDDYNDPNSGNHISRTYEGIFVNGEINVHIGQHIAVGYFHQRSVFGNYHEDSGGNGGKRLDKDGQHLMHGLNLRFSTGRTSKFRPYIQFKYVAHQIAIDYEGFTIAREGTGAAAGVGLMLRLGHKLYINLFEVEANTFLSDSDVLLIDTNVFPTVKTGITYNFSKRK
jgi:hypothetical protein